MYKLYTDFYDTIYIFCSVHTTVQKIQHESFAPLHVMGEFTAADVNLEYTNVY